MTALAPGELTSGHLAETVEAALDAEDCVPLVRLVFDAVTASLTSNTTKQALLTRAPQGAAALSSLLGEDEDGNVPGIRRASDQMKANRREVAAPVINLLEQIVETRSTELAQICRGNAEEIVSSLQELEAMREGTDELRERVTDGDAMLREAGTTFLNGLEQLQDLRRVESSVAASCQAVGSAKQLVQLCAQAGRAINENHLFKAFSLLARAQSEFLGNIADPSQSDGEVSMGRDQGDTRMRIDVRLHAFLTARVLEMQKAIQQKATADFNTWLVTSRGQAREVGMLALRKAAWERQREESLMQQRWKLAAALPTVTDPEAAAAQLAKPLSTRFAGSAKLNPKQQPAAAAMMEQGPVDPKVDFLKDIDMSQLHRCVLLHTSLGKLPSFQVYYQMNRRMQLNTDLSAQASFVQQHQNYLAQLVGFFVIEERVGRVSDAMGGGQVGGGWETAVACLKLAMETAFETITDAATVLAIKDVLLLACSALGGLGYHVAPLVDLLMNARHKYQDLLSASLKPIVDQLVEDSSTTQHEVATAQAAAELSVDLGLPLVNSDEGGLGPHPPFPAPFSDMVPTLVHLIRKYVEESAAFAWGLASPSEVLAVVRLQRDVMMTQLPLTAMENCLKARPNKHSQALDHALQTMADIDALSLALQALDDFTFVTVRGGGPKDRQEKMGSANAVIGSAMSIRNSFGRSLGAVSGTETSVSTTSSKIPTSQTKTYSAGLTTRFSELIRAAEVKVMDVLSFQLREVVKKSPPQDWAPEAPVQTAGSRPQYVLSLLEFIKAALEKFSKAVPVRLYHRVAQSLIHCVGNLLLGLLLADESPGYNLYGLFRYNGDCLAIYNYTVTVGIPGLEEGLLGVLQFCNLMVTGRLEEILDGSKRAANYAAIDLKQLLVLLRKYREVPGKGGTSQLLGKPKQPDSFLKKKTTDRVAKQIRTHLENAGITDLPK